MAEERAQVMWICMKELSGEAKGRGCWKFLKNKTLYIQNGAIICAFSCVMHLNEKYHILRLEFTIATGLWKKYATDV